MLCCLPKAGVGRVDVLPLENVGACERGRGEYRVQRGQRRRNKDHPVFRHGSLLSFVYLAICITIKKSSPLARNRASREMPGRWTRGCPACLAVSLTGRFVSIRLFHLEQLAVPRTPPEQCGKAEAHQSQTTRLGDRRCDAEPDIAGLGGRDIAAAGRSRDAEDRAVISFAAKPAIQAGE